MRVHNLIAVASKSLAFVSQHPKKSAERRRKFFRAAAALERNRFYLRQALCVVLIPSLLVNSTPAAAKTIVRVAQEGRVSFVFWLHTSGLLAKLKRGLTGQDLPERRPQERQSERDSRVRRLRISPEDVTARIGETVRFVAVAYDENDDTIGGVNFTWRAHGGREQAGAVIAAAGEFSATVDGKFKIFVEGAGHTAQTDVTVLEDAPVTKGQPLKVRDLSTRDLPPGESQGRVEAAPRRNARADRNARSAF